MPVNVTFNLNLAQNTSRILLGYQILILIYNYPRLSFEYLTRYRYVQLNHTVSVNTIFYIEIDIEDCIFRH